MAATSSQSGTMAIVVHGGAGLISTHRAKDKLEIIPKAVLAGWQVLSAAGCGTGDGGAGPSSAALKAAIEAVVVMEDAEAFNCGYGSMPNEDGEVEMDAGVMDGLNRRYGAVGAIKGFANPIRIAEKVMTSSRSCLLCAGGAARFAVSAGFEPVPNNSLLTPTTVQFYEGWKVDRGRSLKQNESGGGEGTLDLASKGTVGAVAMDADGNLGAATSTGGILGNQAGRIGDSPLAGMGVFADNALGPAVFAGAVSTTGNGECLMRSLAAFEIARSFGEDRSPDSVILEVLNRMSSTVGGEGGAIAITRSGQVGINFNSERMAWGYLRADSGGVNPEVHYGCSRGEHLSFQV